MRRIYLLHFDTPFHHAEHYLGSADVLTHRILDHAKGNGANLMRHVRNAGITFIVVKTWAGDRKMERRLKNRGGAKRSHCPVCRGKMTYEEAKHNYWRLNKLLEAIFHGAAA